MGGPYDPAAIGAVTTFEDPNCTGQTSRVYWNPEDPIGGQYNRNDLAFGGMRDKTMNSITIPEGYYVELFEWEGFGGPSYIIRGEYEEIKSQKMKCHNVPKADR